MQDIVVLLKAMTTFETSQDKKLTHMTSLCFRTVEDTEWRQGSMQRAPLAACRIFCGKQGPGKLDPQGPFAANGKICSK